MSYDDWKTTDTTEPDPQCDMCGGAFHWSELDDEMLCSDCSLDERRRRLRIMRHEEERDGLR